MSTLTYEAELSQLQSLGFKGKNQNISLLKRTKGNVEIVAKFLSLKAELRHAKANGSDVQAIKRQLYEVKKNVPNRGYYEQQEKKIAKKLAKEAKIVNEEVIAEVLPEPIPADDSPKSIKRVARELKKQEKRAKRLEERNVKKEAKELAKKLSMIDRLPDNVNQVYLDGNNMLFVLDILRKKALNRKMNKAEQLLEAMALSWVQEAPQLHQCTLIFDDTKTNSMDGKLKVCSARPFYGTSDEALIEWCKQLDSNMDKSTVAVFTSDRALTEILKTTGVQVFKSKAWFNVMRKVVNVEDASVEDSLDDWSQKWLAQFELNR